MSSRNVIRRDPIKVMYILTNRPNVSRTHTRINEETGTFRNEKYCGGIGTLKLHMIHVLLKWPAIITMYDVTI